MKYWGGEENLKKIQKRDSLKDKLCKQAGIKLIRIPYWKKNNLEEFITEKLNQSRYNTIMSAKSDMMDMINKKAKRIGDIRERTSRSHDYKDIVIAFFKNMDKHYYDAESANDLKWKFKKEHQLMYSRIRSIHPSIGVYAQWNADDDAVDWKQLRVIRVEINSPPDVSAKLNMPEQIIIDESDILLEILGI